MFKFHALGPLKWKTPNPDEKTSGAEKKEAHTEVG